MPRKYAWAWEIYFAIVAAHAVVSAAQLISPLSPVNLYVNMLAAFDKRFYITYFACALQILLNIIHLIPLALYIRQTPFLNPKFWQYLFILRILFDIVGHPYETKTLTSLYYSNHRILMILFVQTALTYLPSYIACYQYAFNRTNIFSKS